MCVLLHLLICTALRAHIFVVEALYKINYYYYGITSYHKRKLWYHKRKCFLLPTLLISIAKDTDSLRVKNCAVAFPALPSCSKTEKEK